MSKNDEFFQKMLSDAEAQAESLSDTGHKKLVEDIEKLLADASNGHFHDFHKNGLPAPKMSLMNELNKMQDNIQNGSYDN